MKTARLNIAVVNHAGKVWPDPKAAIELVGDGVDELRAKARAMLTAQNRKIRSLSVGVDGHLYCVVWEDGPPPTRPTPGWVWKKPASSETGKP